MQPKVEMVSKDADSTNQKQLSAYAKCDIFDARIQWQEMVNLYKRSIFVITQTQFATQTQVM